MIMFRVAAHSFRLGAQVIEIWEDDNFIAQITPSDERNTFQIISKYSMTADPRRSQVIGVVPVHHLEIRVGP